MMRRYPLLVLLLALAQTACGGGLPVQSPVVDPALRAEDGGLIQLAPGQSVTVGDVDPLLITFEKLVSDSRCPLDVQCVWQGEVTVQLRLSAAGADTVSTLSTVRGPSKLAFGGRVVALREVAPPPSRRGIDPRLYRIKLNVRVSD